MAPKSASKSDALSILHRRYYEGKPERLASLQEERLNAKVAREIYELRVASGLTQRQLAALVKTTASVICRLENADYNGHSLSMLQRIAAALERTVEVNFVPIGGPLSRDDPRRKHGPSAAPKRAAKKPR